MERPICVLLQLSSIGAPCQSLLPVFSVSIDHFLSMFEKLILVTIIFFPFLPVVLRHPQLVKIIHIGLAFPIHKMDLSMRNQHIIYKFLVTHSLNQVHPVQH